MSAPVTQKVRLARRDGPTMVDAEVYGLWAVTPVVDSVPTERASHHVTHVPTGWAAGAPFTQDGARRFAQALAAECSGPEWEATHPEAITKDMLRSARIIYDRVRSESP